MECNDIINLQLSYSVNLYTKMLEKTSLWCLFYWGRAGWDSSTI